MIDAGGTGDGDEGDEGDEGTRCCCQVTTLV